VTAVATVKHKRRIFLFRLFDFSHCRRVYDAEKAWNDWRMKEAFLIEKNLTSGIKLPLACALLCGGVMTQNDGGVAALRYDSA